MARMQLQVAKYRCTNCGQEFDALHLPTATLLELWPSDEARLPRPTVPNKTPILEGLRIDRDVRRKQERVRTSSSTPRSASR
jgi:hypothetical protein